MPDLSDIASVVRALNTAAKALRLYPSGSPIPRQSAEAACASLAALLNASSSLTLVVGRNGIEYRDGGESAQVGGPDLAEDLRSHGVAEVSFDIGCSPEDLLAFLGAAVTDPARLPTGLPAAIARAGVRRIRPHAVNLIVADAAVQGDEDADAFLARLASDPNALAAWLAAAAFGDEATMAEGLRDIADAGGRGGPQDFGATLAAAFKMADPRTRDAVLGLGIDGTEASGIVGTIVTHLGAEDVGEALADGLYGKNMLSLSNALTKLPLAEKLESVLEEVRRLLPGRGHDSKEVTFLEHMLDVRSKREAEAPLTSVDGSYEAVARAASVSEDEIDRGARAAVAVREDAAERSVKTVLTLLDQQRDFDFYCKTLDGLAAMVPGLLERGNIRLAARIIGELAAREARTTQPWPELTNRLRATLAAATGPRTMGALLQAVADAGPEERGYAREILRVAPDTSQTALLETAMATGAEGVAAAEALVGRRVVDMLAAYAPRATVAQLPAIVTRLSLESEPRAVAALEAVLRRPDPFARREAATGLAAADNARAARLAAGLLADPDAAVAARAAQVLGKMTCPQACTELTRRLGEIDIDGKDFEIGREIVGALARHGTPEASAALERLAARKAFIKRGRFAEVQELARTALASQGGAR